MAKKTGQNIYLQWDILFDGIKTKKHRTTVVESLLQHIKGNNKKGSEMIPLKYEVFKSESNKSLYVLRVYKLTESPDKPIRPDKPVKVKALGPGTIDTDSTESSFFSGPIRPSGPPPPPPPGVISLTPTL